MAVINRETAQDQAGRLLDSSIKSVSDFGLARKRIDKLPLWSREHGYEDKVAYAPAHTGDDKLKKVGLHNCAGARRLHAGKVCPEMSDAAPAKLAS